jgi:hypothetical protein
MAWLWDKPYLPRKLIKARTSHCNVNTEKIPVFLKQYNPWQSDKQQLTFQGCYMKRNHMKGQQYNRVCLLKEVRISLLKYQVF